MRKLVVLLTLIAVVCMVVYVVAQDAKKADAAKYQYVGVKKCKMCHKGTKKGNIYEKWTERKHSKAYATLATDEAKKVAKEAGVKGDPQQAPECLVCHVTAYNAPADEKAKTLTMEEGVSCEACHGPGSKYKSLKVMKGVYKGTMKGDDYGLIEPDEKVCAQCHNEKSPTYKPIKFEEALKTIAHPVPPKAK